MHQKLTETLLQYKKIILVGGGTGGHIQPIVSLIKYMRNTHDSIDYLWIGGIDSQEANMAKESNIQFKPIPTLKLSTTRSFKIFLYPIFLIFGFWKTRSILKDLQKKNQEIAIFSKGGPGSVAIGMATWSLSLPLFIHESDTIPGRSNKILGKIASKIFLGFENARHYFDASKCETIGQILDPIFTEQSDTLSMGNYPITWKTPQPHILVICGSQGSRAIFEAILEQFRENTNYEWIISLGKLNGILAPEFEKIANCRAFDWINQHNIAHLIQDTTIAITRGSATTLAELTAFQHKPNLIIIPLPYSAENHQFYNAKEYENMGYTILEQQNINNLKNTLGTILK